MSRQDIFGHRYYRPSDSRSSVPKCGIQDTRTVSIVPHNGAYLAECLDGGGDVTFYLEDFPLSELVTLVRGLFIYRTNVKIDEGG